MHVLSINQDIVIWCGQDFAIYLSQTIFYLVWNFLLQLYGVLLASVFAPKICHYV